MPLTASSTVRLGNPATLPSHQPRCQSLSICTHTHALSVTPIWTHTKNSQLSFTDAPHDSTQLAVLSLVVGMHWSPMATWCSWMGGWVGVYLYLYMSLSVSTCLTELNEITVIQLDQSEEEIQILISSSPVSDSHITFSPLSLGWTLVSPRHLHLSPLFTYRLR